MALNIDVKFEEKLTCVFKNDIRNLATFHQSSFKGFKIGTLKKNWLVSSKLTWAIWRILTRALESLKHLHFNGLLLTKVYNWAKKIQRSYVWWHWRLLQSLKENWLVLSKMTWRIWQIFVYRLKNSDFIFERKMAELNQNKNSKRPDRPDVVWKIYFNLEINE